MKFNAKLACALCAIWGFGLAKAPAQNLVVNGNFATGNFSGWTETGNTTYLEVIPNGSGGYNASMGTVGALAYISQTLATVSGTTYVLTYQLGSDGDTPNEFKAVVGTTTLTDLINIPAHALTPYTYDFTATSASTLLEFGFRDDPGFLTFTDASVTSLTPVVLTFTTSGLTANERAPVSSINEALVSGHSSPALTNVFNALALQGGTTGLAAAADELSPTKFNSFASTTAINNEVFATQDMDIYLQGLRDGHDDGFASGNGQLDSSGLVVNDPNVDPGLQMIHSRMLAWNDSASTITDMPGAVLGGVDMKAMKPSVAAPVAEKPWDFFVRGNVVLAQGFSQADVPHFDADSESVVVGADYHVTKHFLAGVTASYAHTDATLDTFNSSATVDSYSPGVYASYADGGGYVNFIGRYSYNTYTENRDVAFLGQTADGATTGNEGSVDLDGGYDFHSGPWAFGPVAGVQYTHLTVNSYNEQNSDAALAVNEDQTDSLRSRLGGSVRYTLNDGGMRFIPHLEATWQHEFLDQSRELTSSFTEFSGGSFTVRTQNSDDDSALVDVGLDAQVDDTITVFGDYVVQAGQDDYFGQSLQAGVRVNF